MEIVLKRSIPFLVAGSLPQDIQYGSGREESMIMCFCCGVCCTKYQVRLSLTEARRIADEMGLAFDEWLDRYVDKFWQCPESLPSIFNCST